MSDRIHPRTFAVLSLFLGIALSTEMRAGVLVVDGANGPGTDFTSLATAVPGGGVVVTFSTTGRAR